MANNQQLFHFKLGKQPQQQEEEKGKKVIKIGRDLGDGSSVVYFPSFIPQKQSWDFFHFLNHHIPWSTPTIHVFGKPFLQPRDSCYVASKGLKELTYSGHKPHAYHWDDFPPLKQILDQVHQALPGTRFNSLLLNRYKTGNHYVGWHADNETLQMLFCVEAWVAAGDEGKYTT
uniref:DNA oxidative demethylase ALKBH2 n=1 Tax=Tanacetum cinerariifolium TaxID=118510 RepID=A0A6L2MXL5_TANCI|nr:DNA oxidative demethylase ALKBH2 [Tanacetum cinerariifolium]